VNGKSYSFTSQESALSGSNAPRYRTGQIVRVAYDPTNPDHKPRDISNKSTAAYAMLGMILGGVIVLAGFAGIIYALIKH
jgi:hypothetical protein